MSPGTRRSALGGVLTYCVAACLLAAAVALALRLGHLDLRSPVVGVLLLACMWIPALVRLIAVRAVDRGWTPPLPLKRWGRPRIAIPLVPLALVSVIYLAAYGAGIALGVDRSAPAWSGARLLIKTTWRLSLAGPPRSPVRAVPATDPLRPSHGTIAL